MQVGTTPLVRVFVHSIVDGTVEVSVKATVHDEGFAVPEVADATVAEKTTG